MSSPDWTVLVTLTESQREDFFTDDLEARLGSLATVEYSQQEAQLTEAALAERIPGVDVLVTGWGSPTVSEQVLEAADELELIAHTGGSVASYVSEAVYEQGISVSSANRPMARFVAELTLGHVITAERAITTAHEQMRAGEYPTLRPDRSLIDARVGLVGLGTIGRYLLPMLAPFDVSVRLYDPYVSAAEITEYEFVQKASLEGALEAADVVSIHAARTPETIGMIGSEQLATIPDDALLVNTARAELVERAPLLEELESGRIRGALDVFHAEPPADESPLWDLENVQLTPHLGGHGPHEQFTETMIDEIERLSSGDSLQHAIPREQAIRMTR